MLVTTRTQGFSSAAGASTAPAGNRFAIELPLADTSAAGAVAFTQSVLREVQRSAPGAATLVFADAEAATAANAMGLRCWHLPQACREERLEGLLVLVGPAVEDVSEAQGGGGGGSRPGRGAKGAVWGRGKRGMGRGSRPAS
jgi:hypothetical protein